MTLRAFIRGVTPPFLWNMAKRLVVPVGEVPLEPFIDECVGSHSQYGEDLVIDVLLGSPSGGVYVDVGANDHEVLSNTKRFYDRGWRGINVEPNTVLWDALSRQRPEDVNLNIGVAPDSGQMVFYEMDPSTLSTFSADAVKDNLALPGTRVVSEVEVAVEPLRQVLAAHLNGRTIDFLSVDTEGLDLAVLMSNDWSVYRPRLVLAEVAWGGGGIAAYLKEQGYAFVWCNGTNGIFMDSDAACGQPGNRP